MQQKYIDAITFLVVLGGLIVTLYLLEKAGY